MTDAPLVPDPTRGRPLRRRRLVAVGGALVVVLGAGALLTRDDSPAGPPAGAWTIAPHEGLGAWVDVYDWTLQFTDGRPPVGPGEVEAMAEAGVQTLYIQTAHTSAVEPGVIEEERLRSIIQRAYDRGLHVVAWYLPSLVDPAADLQRLLASAALPVGGLGIDIESLAVPDPVERNRLLLLLGDGLRAALGPDKALAAITPSAIHLQVVNPDFWPDFPWAELPLTYDVLLPMTYWSIRLGDLRDGTRYVGENLDRIRFSVQDREIPIAPIGGIADGVTIPDLEGMVRSIETRGAVGGSLYDWVTSRPEHWEALAPLRAAPPPDG
ncbi:MAG: hypothetical protein Q8K72_05205 [Acidimicrobiales bacterium]|nr:hypothetical protein [Acidimicrobiales bacterium]